MSTPINQRRVSVSTIAQDLGSLALSTFPKRPGYGEKGTQINALVNFFKIDITSVPDLLSFSFKIKSKEKDDAKITPRYRQRVVYLLLQQNIDFKSAASDYASIFISTKPLTQNPTTSKTYIVDYFEPEEDGPRADERQVLFYVTVNFLERFNMQTFRDFQSNQQGNYPLLERHIAAINIILARIPAQNPGMITTARREKYFDVTPSNGRRSLGNGLEVYKGYFKSAKLTINGLMVNLNVAASAMYWDGPLDKLISQLLAQSRFKTLQHQLQYLDTQLTRLCIEHKYLGRKVRKSVFKIARAQNRSLPPTSANVVFIKDNQQVTVEQYFHGTYPNARPKGLTSYVINVGDTANPIYIPSDLCMVVSGQPYRGLLPHASQTSEMIKFACRRPGQNMDLILKEGLPQLGVGVAGGPLDRFRLGIGHQMTQIAARQLKPPSISYAGGTDSRIGSGSWNMSGKKFKIPAKEDKMKFSYLEILSDSRPKSASNRDVFLQNMNRAIPTYTNSRAKVVAIPGLQHQFHVPQGFHRRHMLPIWDQFLRHGVQLVFVILPDRSALNYSVIKSSADTQAGIHTVCTVRHEQTDLIKVSVGEIANLMLKVNIKLGGVNSALQIPPAIKTVFGNEVMIIGADVVHPPPGAMPGAPSAAAVVGSVDQQYFQYPGSFHLQQPDEKTKKAVEFIKEFGELCQQRLRLYRERNKSLPNKIIIVRDGVADNMFAQIVNMELSQLKRTFSQVYGGHQDQPKVLFMVGKKRGHTRFYQPKPSSPGFDKNGNPLPGFVVDSQITDAKLWDWYQISHKCLQGTSKPAHYVVLHDEIGMTADHIQELTHGMCFLWGRSTTSISIHPAARAADVMCERAKVYLHEVYFPDPDNVREYSLAGGHWPGIIASNLKGTMFYI